MRTRLIRLLSTIIVTALACGPDTGGVGSSPGDSGSSSGSSSGATMAPDPTATTATTGGAMGTCPDGMVCIGLGPGGMAMRCAWP